jgi:hypothetical protein
MANALVVVSVLVPGVLAWLWWLARRLPRLPHPSLPELMSAVSRQHLDLFQGGRLNESAVASARARLAPLLERGEVGRVEEQLVAGTQFVVQVQALAEIGSDSARQVLERQLLRRHCDDPLEQSWYWIDVARGLRTVSKVESLAPLLRCATAASRMPLGHLLAAETVCFDEFSDYLRVPLTPLGQAALRVLHQTLIGLRNGVPPQLLTEGRLGEVVALLWEHCPPQPDALMVRVLAEALRIAHRLDHIEMLLGEQAGDRAGFRWQVACLKPLEEAVREYLVEAGPALADQLAGATVEQQYDLLTALNDIRADVAGPVFALLARPDFAHRGLAAEVLAWSREPRVGPALCAWARQLQPTGGWSFGWSAPTGPIDLLLTVIRAMRGHAGRSTEAMLLEFASTGAEPIRCAALGALAWQEPIRPAAVHACLQAARGANQRSVRHAARAARARLGERAALQEFRNALVGTDALKLMETMRTIADEGLMWLWPDLDRVADAEDAEVAFQAREALERMREQMLHSLGQG